MKTTTQLPSRAEAADFYIASPSHFAAQVLAIVLRRLRIRNDRRQLESMPDYLLHDLGISRRELDYLTRFDARTKR